MLFARRLDHLMDLVGIECFVAEGLRGGPDDPFHPTWLLRQLTNFALRGEWRPFADWNARSRGKP